MPIITSRNHPLIKQLIKLESSAAYRRKTGLTLLDGEHLLQAYLAEAGVPQLVIMTQSYAEQNGYAPLAGGTCKTATVSDALFQLFSPVKTPAGILGLIAIPKPGQLFGEKIRYSVLLEDIQDPGNLGSIIRSAAAAGVEDVYLSKHCADAWSPKTLRAAMGAHFLLRMHELCNLPQVAQEFPGTVIATALGASVSLYEAVLTGAVAFAFGNEGAGLSDDLLQTVAAVVAIPMPGKTESLNVAAAAAICLFEKVRQDRIGAVCEAIEMRSHSSV
ncbi:MAG: RNA methyltransferase [Nitrosomonas sp.]|nr:MAG: RNA methyltransferase [Nitrosomonas sp.]